MTLPNDAMAGQQIAGLGDGGHSQLPMNRIFPALARSWTRVVWLIIVAPSHGGCRRVLGNLLVMAIATEFSAQGRLADMKIEFAIRGEFIQLDQLLKATGLTTSGGMAHAVTSEGRVTVDGQIETRKRAKLRAGQCVRYLDEEIVLRSGLVA